MSGLELIRNGRDQWRTRWLSAAEALRCTGKASHAEEADFITNILREEQEAAERDQAARRRYLLERTGSVEEVAGETGYTPSHLYALLRAGRLVDVSDGGAARLRYADVWSMKGVALEIQDDIAHAAGSGMATRKRLRGSEAQRDRVVAKVVGRVGR